MIMNRFIILIAFSALIFGACNTQTSAPKSTTKVKKDSVPESLKAKKDPKRFPNKRSELAILMRNLIDELNANKQKVANGEAIDVKWTEKYKTILTATPTDEDDSGPLFHGFGTKFLADLKAFEEAESKDRIELYNAMVQSCVDCHKKHCQGPIPAIKKLRI
jgi:cytochrome c553